MRKTIECSHCGTLASKQQMHLQFETFYDTFYNRMERRPKRVPVLLNYSLGKKKFEKEPDRQDIKLVSRIAEEKLPDDVPVVEFPDCQMTRVGRMRTTNMRCVHHMFLPRATHPLTAMWRRTVACGNDRLRNILLFFVEQAIWGMSVLARYAPTHFSQVNQYLSGVFYVGSHIAEVSPWYILDGKLNRLKKAFDPLVSQADAAIVSTGDASIVSLPDNSIDYVFTRSTLRRKHLLRRSQLPCRVVARRRNS